MLVVERSADADKAVVIAVGRSGRSDTVTEREPAVVASLTGLTTNLPAAAAAQYPAFTCSLTKTAL